MDNCGAAADCEPADCEPVGNAVDVEEVRGVMVVVEEVAVLLKEVEECSCW